MNRSIDVIIPTYNCSKYIEDAIISAIRQGEVVKRIIVVDDGSTDNTKDIVHKLSLNNSLVKYFNKQNGGPSSARNYGIKLSSADYIAFLDADDIWKDNKLINQLAAIISKSKKVGVVYSDYEEIDEKGALIYKKTNFHSKDPVEGDIYENLLNGNIVMGSASAVLVKRACFNKCGIFNENLSFCEDWDMWLRIANKYQFAFINKTTVNIRQRSNSNQKQYGKAAIDSIYFMKICNKRKDYLSLSAKSDLRNRIIQQFLARPYQISVNIKIFKSILNSRNIIFPTLETIIKSVLWVVYSEFINPIKIMLKQAYRKEKSL